MDARTITAVSHAVQAGSMQFPEVVARLLETGVELYHVDFTARLKTYYGADGDVAVTALTFEDLPSIAEQLDVAALRANLIDSQRHGQAYRDFVRRAMVAGVQGYIAFLRGKRVMYWGRCGNQHIEWFPGAMPLQNAAADR